VRKRGKRHQKKALRTTTFPWWNQLASTTQPAADVFERMFNLCTDGEMKDLVLLFPSKKEMNKMMRRYQKKAAK